MRRNLRVDEVAAALSCSKTSVYRLIETGDLPAFKLRPGGAYRVPAGGLERFIRARLAAQEVERLALTFDDNVSAPNDTRRAQPRFTEPARPDRLDRKTGGPAHEKEIPDSRA
ncbi:hypothetical protein TRIP_B220087 [uncultured Desulfatiglans sp.]|nr:hypothetical protein TRIP_B220087 [uncultured Desulfatiglans sp.]